MTEYTYPSRPKITLVGNDGNAFALIGLASATAKEASWPKQTITNMVSDLMESQSYDDLLRKLVTIFEESEGE